jgi:2',3'-cyclic-nucleotide 2'-phosphodiesterase/3'-nucleotidase
LKQYREQHAEIMTKVGSTEAAMIRRYIEESDIGNLFADIFVDATGADVAMIHSGSLRKDLPQGDILLVDILDSYPFVDSVDVKEMSGDQIRRALEQSLTFERGILQLSGLQVVYDLKQPKYSRVVSVKHAGQDLADDAFYTVAAGSFLAEGGDLYDSFPESEVILTVGKVSDVIVEYFQSHESIATPKRGRQWQVAD